MTTLDQIAGKIVKEQELVIGSLAWTEAEKVQGLRVVNEVSGEVTLNNGDPKEVINHLVSQYERLFGRASREVCIEAAAILIRELAPADVPSSLSA